MNKLKHVLGYIALTLVILFLIFIIIKEDNSDDGKVIFVDSSLQQASLSKFKHIEDGDYINSGGLKLSMALENDLPDMDLVSLYSSDGEIYFISSDGRFLFDGNLIDTDIGYSVSEKELSRVNFSGYGIKEQVEDSTASMTTNSSSTIEGETEKTDAHSKSYESAIKERIRTIKSASTVQPSSRNLDSGSIQIASGNANNTEDKGNNAPLNQECLITFGGFNQPRVGYDDKCNRLSPDATQDQIKTLINGFPDEFFVRYEAEEERSEIYVFTDYTCHYCQKLHDKIDSFLSNGISVNYIFYPRAIGIQGQEAKAEEVVTNMSSAWCSDDAVEATNLLYKRGSVPYASCKKNDTKLDSPVRQHYILGMMFEITGTPLIVGSNGKTTYGFRSVGVTLSRLGM